MKLSSFGVLSLSALATAAPVDTKSHHQVRQDNNPEFPPEFGASPFTEFTNCSDDQKKDIERSWEDTKTLLDATKDRNLWGPIEKRYFGDDIGEPMQSNRRDEINRVLNNADGLRFGANKIPVTCGGPTCSTYTGAVTTSKIGVAWSSNIAFCETFFKPERKFLEDIVEDHKRLGWVPGKDHLVGKGRITLHELAHVHGISPTSGIMKVVDVNIDGQEAYGFEACEKNALLILDEDDGTKNRDVPQPSDQMPRNADSYALYATEKWFAKNHDNEIPPSAIKKDAPDDRSDTKPEEGGPTKAVTILLENQRSGVAADAKEKMKWLFFATEFGREVVCKSDPPPVAEIESTEKVINTGQKVFPSGTTASIGLGGAFGTGGVNNGVSVKFTTQDGDCEYKNGGNDEGAVYCGDQVHECRLHANWEAKTSCDGKLTGEGGAAIIQKEAIVCEW